MPTTQLQLRRGNTAQTSVFTGAIGEVTVDTDRKTITVHDGSTVGGTYVATNIQLTSAYGNANAANVLAQAGFDQANSGFNKALALIGLSKKIELIWDEKVALGLVSKDKQVGTDTSSLNGHILEPGSISNPLSLIWPAFVFLCGPFPFIGNPGVAASIASLESPLWWAFYAVVLFQFFKFRKTKFLRDPQILFTLIFLAGEIAFSALVEVNLGTSFRHRSIILVPLVFLYVRLAQRDTEQKEKELEGI